MEIIRAVVRQQQLDCIRTATVSRQNSSDEDRKVGCSHIAEAPGHHAEVGLGSGLSTDS